MNLPRENGFSAIAGLAVIGLIVAAGVVFASLESNRLPGRAFGTIAPAGIIVVSGILGAVVNGLKRRRSRCGASGSVPAPT
ncbi:MAG: hypothetical protein IT200_12825 [Thermoleophilia bacterium]|nr:hypothetical protein [Thermoleophilia bacterium]